MKNTFQVLPLSALIVSATLLTGCSSSSSNITTNLGGNASDGYIVGATVFLDLNNNLTRDANEPQTTTGAKGLYNLDLTGLTPAQIAAGKIVLTGGIDDSTNAPFTSILTAKTDGNSTSAAITPITSLITALVEAGTPLATAKTQIATALGVPANLVDQDPIAHSATNPDLLKQAVALQKAMEVLAKAEANGGDEKEAMQRIAKAIAKQAAATNAGTTATKLIDTAVTNQGTEFTQAAKVTNVKELAKDAAKLIEAVLETAKVNGELSEAELNRQIKGVQAAVDAAKNSALAANDGDRLDAKIGNLTGSIVTLVSIIKNVTTIDSTTTTGLMGIVNQVAKEKESNETPYTYPNTLTDADQKKLLMAIVDKVEDKVKNLSPAYYRTIMQEMITDYASWMPALASAASATSKTGYQLLEAIVASTAFENMTLAAAGPSIVAQIQTIAQSLVPAPAEPATVTLNKLNDAIEGNNLTYQVSLSKAIDQQISVSIAYSAPSQLPSGTIAASGNANCSTNTDFTNTVNSVTIPAGSTQQTFTVTTCHNTEKTTATAVDVSLSNTTASVSQLSENTSETRKTAIVYNNDASYRLNDTGWLTFHYSGDHSNLNAYEDASHGRDKLAASNQLTKVGSSATNNGTNNGFDFTKIDANGNPLPASATSWDCILDNNTGLMWEHKTEVANSLRFKGNTFAYVNTDTNKSGGTRNSAGNTTIDGNTCSGSGLSRCDTELYTNAINALGNNKGLCGFNNWRVPSVNELLTMLDYSRVKPALDTIFFTDYVHPEGHNYAYYWTSTPSLDLNNTAVWGVNFYNGKIDSDPDANYRGPVRLVRNAQ